MRADSSSGGTLKSGADVTLQRHEGPPRLGGFHRVRRWPGQAVGEAEPQGGPLSKVQTVAKRVSQSHPAPHSSHWTALCTGVGRPHPHTSFCTGVRSRSPPGGPTGFSPLRKGGRWAVWDPCFSDLSPQSEPGTAPGSQHCRTGERYASFYAKPRLCRTPFLKPFPTSTHLHGRRSACSLHHTELPPTC